MLSGKALLSSSGLSSIGIMVIKASDKDAAFYAHENPLRKVTVNVAEYMSKDGASGFFSPISNLIDLSAIWKESSPKGAMLNPASPKTSVSMLYKSLMLVFTIANKRPTLHDRE